MSLTHHFDFEMCIEASRVVSILILIEELITELFEALIVHGAENILVFFGVAFR